MRKIESRSFDLEDYSFLEYYILILESLKKMPWDQRKRAERKLCRQDIYYLLRYACHKGFMESPYFYQQCKFADDIEFNRGGLDGWMFIWFREAGKSLIMNGGKHLQHILTDPNKSTIVLSYSAPAAKDFIIEPIAKECETNTKLHKLFDDILWGENPKRSALWNADKGYNFKRDVKRKEPTLSAYGLDAPPTRMHADYICYDDVVSEQTVQTDDRMIKTKEEFQHTMSLGTNVKLVGIEPSQMWYIDTIYDEKDNTANMIDSDEYKVDLLPCYAPDGVTLFNHTEAAINKLRGRMSQYIFSCQYMLDPIESSRRKFSGHLKYYDRASDLWDNIGLCDPAGGFKKSRDHDPDRTAMGVIGRDELGNEYFRDGVYDYLDLRTRIKVMFDLVRRYKIREFYYEKSSMNADIDEINRYMTKTGIHFELIPFIPVDKKEYRIDRHVIGRIENGILKFPRHMYYQSSEGKTLDLIDDVLKVEMTSFPHGKHDDFVDMLAQLGVVPEYGGGSTEPLPINELVHKPRMPKKMAQNTLDDVVSYI